MPKITRIRKTTSVSAVRSTPLLSQEKHAADGVDEQKIHTTESDENKALSRGQRKRLAKREQYMKREKMVLSTLRLKEMEEQKQRIDGMDAIKEALVQTMKENQQRLEVEQQQSDILKTNKSKKEVAQKEISHLNLVLQHPSFKSNPFATMQEHLRNTLAEQAKEQEVEAKKERIEEQKKEKEKKEVKKERIRNAKYEKGRKHRRRQY